MKRTFLTLFLMLSVLLLTGETLLKETFEDLSCWQELTFPLCRKKTRYVAEHDSDGPCLRTESADSASALMMNDGYHVYDYPVLAWEWKVDSVYKKGNILKKSGDDFPIRVYIIFDLDLGKLSKKDRAKAELIRKIHGHYPPHSMLTYVWESRKQERDVYPNPNRTEVKMIILRQGTEDIGVWQHEAVNIVKDYRRLYEKDPPETGRVVIMNDSDNTGESAVSWVRNLCIETE